MKKNLMLITDGVDLTQKKIVTKDDFYSSNAGKSASMTDSSETGMRILDSVAESKFDYYVIISTSDKEINNRLYSYDAWKKTVDEGLWLKPYKKPVLYNHDLYASLPFGRIVDTFFVNNVTKQVVSSSLGTELPKEVIHYYDSIGAFKEGSGTLIGKINPSEILKRRLDSDLDVTVSQSSMTDKTVCSVCGKEYFGEECNHIAGYEYKVEGKTVKCLVTIGDFDPIEISFVNRPANDVSVVCKVEKFVSTKTDDSKEKEETKEITDNKHIDEPEVKEEKTKTIKDKENTDCKMNILKDVSKKYIAQKMKLEDDEAAIEKLTKMLETLSDEQIKNLVELTDCLKDVPISQEETEEIKDNEQKASELETDEELKTEDKEEPENKEETKETKDELETEDTKTTETKDSEEKKEETTIKDSGLPHGKFFNEQNKETTIKDEFSPEVLSIIKSYMQ